MRPQPELTKNERIIARELISKGIKEDFKRGLLGFDAILQKWKDESSDNRECFATLYGEIKDFNKMISRRYDGNSNSDIIDVLVMQLLNNLYDASELDVFKLEVKDYIQFKVGQWKEYQEAE